MKSSLLFPPVKRSPNPNNPSTSAGGFGGSKRPQPPVYIPHGCVGLRLLCHSSRVGGLIGVLGSVVKQIQQLTNSKIRVDDPPNSSGDHRVITVIGSPSLSKRIKISELNGQENDGVSVSDDGVGNEWFEVSPVQEGMLRVFERVVEVTAEGDAQAAMEGVVSCRLLAGEGQVGAVIGKGGMVVDKIRKDTGCRIKALVSEKLSLGLSSDEVIVEIEGDVLGVKKALVAVTGRLQEFPVPDRTGVHGSRPIEAEPLPVSSVGVSRQQGQMLQSMPSTSFSNASRDGPILLKSVNVSIPDFRRQQQEVAIKILCLNEQIGKIIGKGGSVVKSIQNESGAFVNVGPVVSYCNERLITITAVENVDSQYSPVQHAAVLLFSRYMEAGAANGFDSSINGYPVLAQVVVPSNHVGCLLGKGGVIISEMRKMTGAGLRIIGGNQVPKCTPENAEILQIAGEFVNVQDALRKVIWRLRENIFSNRNSMGTENGSSGRVTNPPHGLHHSLVGSDNITEDLRQHIDYLKISTEVDQPSSPSASTGNLLDTSRSLPSRNGDVALERSRSLTVTNTTVEVVISDDVFGSVFGENDSNLARLRQISGAKVTIEEPNPEQTDRKIVISGTPDETLAAQSLLQAFILNGSS